MYPINSFFAFSAIIAALLVACASAAPQDQQRPPNILLILADDLGYGDVQCLNPQRGRIPTPNIDRLAAEGMIFTDAYSSSSVCTPTRYGLLTGRYCWRTRLQSGVLLGDGKPLIPPQRLTLPKLLAGHGYRTACVGKWHLGLEIPELPGGPPAGRSQAWRYDYSGRISGGPTALGFDWFFGISASLDMWPFAYIENDRFTAPLTVEKQWIRRGPAAADFEAVDVLPTLARKTVDFIAQTADQSAANRPPFFLYLSLTSPHTPIVPTEKWRGRSGLNEYGDFVMQTDAAVGEVLAALEKTGLKRDTLVVLTSDNGCSPAANVAQLEELGHYPSGPFRGYKADIWEGGLRVPFIVSWPARVQAGSRTGQLVCLNDLLATCAELLGERLPDDAGEDSFSFLHALLQREPSPDRPTRDAVVLHSVNGRFAIRQGKWVLALCAGSGGWSRPRDAEAAKQGLPPLQLYDLESDVAQQKNLAKEHPEVVARLRALLEKYVTDGRSTPGKPQRNDADVQLEKN